MLLSHLRQPTAMLKLDGATAAAAAAATKL
jgi:hypothetical protein